MKPQIFPKEIMNNTVIVHQSILSKKRKTIYGIILFVFFSALCSLPFIAIDVYSSASGIIKPQ